MLSVDYGKSFIILRNRMDVTNASQVVSTLSTLTVVAATAFAAIQLHNQTRQEILKRTELCRSVDCFDTLLFRYHGSPYQFYQYLESKFNIKNFAEIRKRADFQVWKKRSLKVKVTLKDVYDWIGINFGWSEEEKTKYLELEKMYDKDFLFPIRSNSLYVNKDTVLTSDTYYTEKELRDILSDKGFSFDTMKVSNFGKALGCVWVGHHRKNNLNTHLGDNVWSDVITPTVAGIRGIYTGLSKRTYVEKMLYKEGFKKMANWMRFVRLIGNPYRYGDLEFKLWNEQIEFNTPLMLWSCLEIHLLCQRYGLNRVLFVTRDCCHLKKYFDAIFGCKYETFTLHCSRKVYENPSQQYIDYFKSLYVEGRTLFVDINGTGRSLYAFFNKHMEQKNFKMFFTLWPMGMNLISEVQVTPDGYLLRQKPSALSIINAAKIEMLNYDKIGTLIRWENGPVREKLEYELELVEPHHESVECAVRCLYKDSFELDVGDEGMVEKILKRYYSHGCLPKYMSHDENLMLMMLRALKINDKKYFNNKGV